MEVGEAAGQGGMAAATGSSDEEQHDDGVESTASAAPPSVFAAVKKRSKRRRTMSSASSAASSNDGQPERRERRQKSVDLGIPEIQSKFDILGEIGSGTFSTVYRARFKDRTLKNQYVALKRLVSTSHPDRIVREIHCLKLLKGAEFITTLKAVVRQEDCSVLVLDYFDHQPFKSYAKDLSVKEIERYMFGLFTALDYVHSKGIIHRDIKPNNFLYHRSTGKCCLVDFGLSQLFDDDGVLSSPQDDHSKQAQKNRERLKGKKRKTSSASSASSKASFIPSRAQQRSIKTITQSNTLGKAGTNGKMSKKDPRPKQWAQRAGTRGYRAPEVLLRCEHQSSAVDIWAAGVIFLSLLSGRFPFYCSGDDMEALAEIASCFGGAALIDVGNRLGKEILLGKGKDSNFGPDCATVQLKDLCLKLRKDRSAFPDRAYDLLQQTLALHPADRITAANALSHSFFDAVKS